MKKFLYILVGAIVGFLISFALPTKVQEGIANFGASTINTDVVMNGDVTLGNSGSDAVTINGSVDLNNSTTMPLNLISPVSVSLSNVATTTAANPAAMGFLRNTGNPKLCLVPEIYISTSNGLWGSTYSVGTTTLAGDASLTVTSTATLIAAHAVVTSTTGIVGNAMANKGSYWMSTTTSQPWIWKTGEYLVAYSNQGGATSAASYISSGGFTTLVGKLTTWCWDTY